MCAIFGIIGEANPSLLKKMSSCQIYRGPDRQNFLTDKKNNFSIGMNRLSVIDRIKGTQPMYSHDGRHVIVFNGTIYNFNEIKKFLITKKINFKTNSDTEVLINAYNYWGKKSFNYFDGMWALAIYDFKKKKLILSRDYVGQKPLFYYREKNKIIFSSQINGIFQYRKDFQVSKKNYEEYLRFNYFPAPVTLYKDIQQVCPGENIEFSEKKFIKTNYWKVENGADYNLFFKPIKKEDIVKKFSRSIKNFLIADKKVGLTLSAGIDSNLIKMIMLKLKNKIFSFTIGFNENSYDEAKFVKKNKYNFNKKKILNERNFIKTFNKIKKNIYFPFGDSSVVPTYELFNLVKKKTNVVLGGDGGDEIFFGYISFKAFYIVNIVKKIFPNLFLRIIKMPFAGIKITTEYMGIQKKIKLFFKYLDKELFMMNNYWISNFDNEDVKQYFKKKTYRNSFHIKKVHKLFKKNSNKMRFVQLFYIKYFLPTILMKVDYSSMLNSVESRSPYLTKDLLNFSLNISTKKNFSLFKNRKLMCDIFSEFIKNYIKIKKHGFAFNKNIILKNQQLLLKKIDNNYMLNPAFFYDKYRKYLNGNYDYEQYLWNEILLNFSRQNLEQKKGNIVI
jgi:asparagine synthase (glutamine-hydrolysing)